MAHAKLHDGGFSDPYDADAVETDADLIDPDDAAFSDDDPLTAHAATPAGSTTIPADRAPMLTGNMSSQGATPQQRARQTQSYLTSSIPGEDRRAPQNTIDESVWATLSRDLLAVWEKMRQVLYPKYLLGGAMNPSSGGAEGEGGSTGQGGLDRLRGIVGRLRDGDVVLEGGMSEGLRDWDLWGPLLFCLLLSLFLSRCAQDAQKTSVFTGVFAIVWIGEAVVTVQIKLLGGSISFFQSVCVIGYTLFPLVIASILSAFGLAFIIRIPVYIVLILWSMAAGISILGGSGVVKNRVGIAVYPLLVFYIGLGCLCLIS